MSFRVVIARKAAREIEDQYEWLAERSRAAANRWRASLLAAVSSLEENPERCPEAPEAEWYGEGLRQILHGERRRVHRVLFEIRGDVVVVLRVRHSAQDLLSPEDW
jgi:plasmid stabilization system protein ParE